MPKPVRKMQKANAAAHAVVLPKIPPELLDRLVKGPMSAEAVQEARREVRRIGLVLEHERRRRAGRRREREWQPGQPPRPHQIIRVSIPSPAHRRRGVLVRQLQGMERRPIGLDRHESLHQVQPGVRDLPPKHPGLRMLDENRRADLLEQGQVRGEVQLLDLHHVADARHLLREELVAEGVPGDASIAV